MTDAAQRVADLIASAVEYDLNSRPSARTAPTGSDEPLPLIRAVPLPDPYPVHDLGLEIAAVVEALQGVVQSPMAMSAGSVLATITLAAQAHINVELPIGHGAVRPVSSFFVTVGRSGERKSATDDWPTKGIKAHESALRRQYDADFVNYRDAANTYEAARKAILAGKATPTEKRVDFAALGPEPKAPLLPIIVMEEPTIEGLAKLLMNGQPSVGVFSAEGGQFVGGHAMKDDAKLRSAAALSRLWDGDDWKRVRAIDGSHTIANRRLSLMVQPDIGAALMSDPVLKDQGLTSRVLMSYPATTMGTRLYREALPGDLVTLNRFNQRLTAAMARPLPLLDGPRNELQPRAIKLSPDARKIWIAFSDHVEGLLAPGSALGEIQGFAAKMAEHAARLAACLTWWCDHAAPTIDADTMTGATNIVEHYADEALRLMQSSCIPADIAAAQRLLDWLHQWPDPFVSVPDICNKGPNALRIAQRAKAAVKILEEHRWLTKKDGGATIDGHRRREAWQIHGRS